MLEGDWVGSKKFTVTCDEETTEDLTGDLLGCGVGDGVTGCCVGCFVGLSVTGFDDGCCVGLTETGLSDGALLDGCGVEDPILLSGDAVGDDVNPSMGIRESTTSLSTHGICSVPISFSSSSLPHGGR